MTIQKYLQFAKSFFFPVLLISVLFVASSAFWTSDTPQNQEDMYDIRLGYPLNFISQNHSRSDVPTSPQYRDVGLASFLEDPLTIFWGIFFLSIFITQAVLITVLFLIYWVFPRSQKFFKLLSLQNVITGMCLGIGVLAMIYLAQVSLSNKEPLSMEPVEGFDRSADSTLNHSDH